MHRSLPFLDPLDIYTQNRQEGWQKCYDKQALACGRLASCHPKCLFLSEHSEHSEHFILYQIFEATELTCPIYLGKQLCPLNKSRRKSYSAPVRILGHSVAEEKRQ